MCIQAHGLSGEQLAAREVEIIDIASVSRDYWSKAIGAPSVDLTAFKSQRTERGPLLKGWMVRSKQHRFFFFLFFFFNSYVPMPNGHMLFSSGLVPSGDDHVQAGDHGRSHMGPRRTPGRLHHCGTPPC